MAFGLSDARATLTIDASGFVSGAQQAAASLDALDASGSRTAQSSALVETRLRSVAAALGSASGESGGYAQALSSAAAAAGNAAARVDQLAVKAEAARAALSSARESAATSAEALRALQEASDINGENIARMRMELDALQQSGSASQTEISALEQSIQELEADSASLAGQIQTETQNVEASGEAAAQAAVKYNSLSAQLKVAEASADKADGKFASLAQTIDKSQGFGALAQGLNKWGTSTLTSASRSLGTMALSMAGLQSGTAGMTLASQGLSTAMNMITRLAGPWGMAIGGATSLAVAGVKKLNEAWNESHDFGAAMQSAIDGAADSSYTASLSNVNLELGDEDHIKSQITEKLQHCFETLTDGKADTPKVVSELHAEIDEEYGGVRAQVDDYFKKAIEGAETEEAKNALIAKQGEILASIDATHEASNALVDSYAGKSTEECKKAKEEIETIQQQVEALIAGINGAKELLDSQYGDAYSKVSKGYYATQQDVEWSLTYVSANRTNAEAKANEAYAAASKALNDAFKGHDGGESLEVEYEFDGVKYKKTGTFDELTHQIEGEHQAAMNTAQAELIAQWNAMIAGLGQSGALGAEATAALQRMAAAVDVKTAIDSIAQKLSNETFTPADLEDLGDGFWQSLGTALDTDGVAAQQMFQNALAISPMAAAALLGQWENPINSALTEGAGEMEGNFGDLLSAALAAGLFEGVEGVDMEDALTRCQALVGQLSAAGEDLEPTSVPVEVQPEVEQINDPSQQPIVVDEPLKVEAPVEVSGGVWTFNEDEVPEGVFGSAFEITPKFALPDPEELNALCSAVSVPIAAEITLPSPEELAALDGVSGEFADAGSNAGSAFVSALNAYLAPAAAAGAAIAAAALNAMRAKLSIHSPSKATFKMGMQTGEGFSLGIAERAEMARQSMKNLSSAALRGASVTNNRYEGARNFTINASVRSDADLRNLSRQIARMTNDANYGRG